MSENDAGTHGIQMDIVTDSAQVPSCATDGLRSIPSAEEMPGQSVAPIETRRIGAQKPLHSSDEIWLRRFYDQVKMIWHQAIGMDSPACLRADFGQGLQKPFAIHIVAEDILATVASICDVIDGARQLHS
jgi:hypothetical protein